MVRLQVAPMGSGWLPVTYTFVAKDLFKTDGLPCVARVDAVKAQLRLTAHLGTTEAKGLQMIRMSLAFALTTEAHGPWRTGTSISL